MGTTKHLYDEEAIAKMKLLAEDIKMCMFCTTSKELPFETRPMATQLVDEDGTFWFLSSRDSDKNQEVKDDDKVQLLYSKAADSHYMVVYGTATISRDPKKIDELWDNFAKAWFKKGKDDPSLTLISVRPDDAYYWDTQHGKMISLLKI